MKRILAFTLALATPLAIVWLALLVFGKNRTPEWTAELDRYVAFQSNPPTITLEIQQRAHARQPWNFTAAMGEPVFQAGDPRAPLATDPAIPWRLPFTDVRTLEVGRPLAYPPGDLWCVLLKYRQSRGKAAYPLREYSAVFVALHIDLYTAEWIVHESRDDFPSLGLAETFRAIGCKLEATTLAAGPPPVEIPPGGKQGE